MAHCCSSTLKNTQQGEIRSSIIHHPSSIIHHPSSIIHLHLPHPLLDHDDPTSDTNNSIRCTFAWTSCPFSPQRCNAECARSIRLKDLERHCFECLFQPVICMKCHQTVHLVDFDVCLSLLLCSALLIVSSKLISASQTHEKECKRDDRHRDRDDLIPTFLSFEEGWNLTFPFVDCLLKDVGCPERINKLDMMDHIKEKTFEHTLMVQRAMDKQKTAKSLLEKKIEFLESVCVTISPFSLSLIRLTPLVRLF